MLPISCLMIINHSHRTTGSSTAMLLSITTPSSNLKVLVSLSISSMAKLSTAKMAYISPLYKVHLTPCNIIISSQAVASSLPIILGLTCSFQCLHFKLMIHKTILLAIDHLDALIMTILIMNNPEWVITTQYPHTLGDLPQYLPQKHLLLSIPILPSFHLAMIAIYFPCLHLIIMMDLTHLISIL